MAHLRFGMSLAALMALAGCISFGGKPPRQLIRLSAEASAPAGAMLTAPAASAIVVAEPDADPSLAATRVPVRTGDTTLAYLKDATWLERPTREFRALLAETLRARGKALVYEDNELGASGHTHLTGRLDTMGYDARTQSVIVRFDAIRQDVGAPTMTKRFEAVVPGVGPTAAQVVPAINHAANDVARQVADWVG